MDDQMILAEITRQPNTALNLARRSGLGITRTVRAIARLRFERVIRRDSAANPITDSWRLA